MTANQARMVLNIAAAYGEDLSIDRARELLGVLAAGFGLRALSRQAVKLVPVGGWAASAAIAYAGTVAMGRSPSSTSSAAGQRVGEKEMAEIQRRAARGGQEPSSRACAESRLQVLASWHGTRFAFAVRARRLCSRQPSQGPVRRHSRESGNPWRQALRAP